MSFLPVAFLPVAFLPVSMSVLLAGICPVMLFSAEEVSPEPNAGAQQSTSPNASPTQCAQPSEAAASVNTRNYTDPPDSQIERMRERARQRRLLWKEHNDPVYIIVQPNESSVDAARKREELEQLQWRNQQERLREGTRQTEEFHRELERSAREIRNQNR